MATELFLRHGYDGTSVKSIAQEIGISTPALYWHFPSKQDIFYAALEQVLRRFLAEVRGQLTADDPRERLAQIVRAHVRFQLERQDQADAYSATFGFRGLVQGLPAECRERIQAAQRSYMEEVREVLRRGREQGAFDFDDLTVATFAFITLCEFPNAWYNRRGRLSPREVADQYVKLALRMVGAKVEKA